VLTDEEGFEVPSGLIHGDISSPLQGVYLPHRPAPFVKPQARPPVLYLYPSLFGLHLADSPGWETHPKPFSAFVYSHLAPLLSTDGVSGGELPPSRSGSSLVIKMGFDPLLRGWHKRTLGIAHQPYLWDMKYHKACTA